MPASVEKTYSDALFTLIVEEHGEKCDALTDVLQELAQISAILDENPELQKIIGTPTVSPEEKEALLETVFQARVSAITYRFLLVLASKRRLSHFSPIYREFKRAYNDMFGIAEITVTTTLPLTDDTRKKIKEKMASVTGKTIVMREKLDPALIGGILIDYGSTRFDGSVKTRLEALKKEITGIIA